MAKLQQVLVELLIGTMAIGGVACLCPAAADAHVVSSATHAHPHHDATSADGAAGQDDCGHEDCRAACERGSAAASKESASGKSKFELDPTSMAPPAMQALAPIAGAVVSPIASRTGLPLPRQTPVQRCDRLLD